MRKKHLLLLLCLSLTGCKQHSVHNFLHRVKDRLTRPAVIRPGNIGPLPASFPKQLRSFSGPVKAFGVDGKPWDSVGIGGPSNVIFVNGNYWVCASGYTHEGSITQDIGCWFGPDLTSLKPYPGNPVIRNTFQKWTAACLEGPDLNTDGKNIYMSYVGFSSNCDDEDHGQIGFSSTSVANFPAGFSPLPSEPQIKKPKQLKWLFRSFVIEINGICYDYSNGGGYVHQPVIASFKTNGPCATTQMDPSAWKFNRFEIAITQPWERTDEVEDPQVFQIPDGTYVMLYGGAWSFKAGYAFTKDPVHGVWTKSDTNPIQQNGVLWLPRIMQDKNGQYWMLGNFNNTPEMDLWKANGQ